MKNVLVFTDQLTAVFQCLGAAFEEFARSHGWRLQVVAVQPVGCDPKEILSVVKPDGVLVYCAYGLPIRPNVCGAPTVYVNLNEAKPGQNVVRHNSNETGRRAADELLRLGFASYGVVGWESPLDWSETRCRAFEGRMKVCGVACRRFDGSWQRKRPARSRKVLGAWLRTFPKPCGIFAANDIVAETVISAALDEGLSVPEDVSVIGVDDNQSVCENAPVSITSIRPDFVRGGRMAAALLQDLMMRSSRKSVVRTYGDECVVRRGSTRTLAHRDPRVSAALEYIRRHACSGIGVADVVAQMKCARRSAELAFRTSVGNSILGEINEVRLARAKELLSDPRQVIGSIPQKCGWQGANFLMRLFKARTGMTMRAWRTQHAR